MHCNHNSPHAATNAQGSQNIKQIKILQSYQIALHTTEKSFMKRRVNQYGNLYCCLKTNKIWVAAATPPFSNRHPDQSAAINIEARPSTRKNTMTIEGRHDRYQFIAIKSFWVCILF